MNTLQTLPITLSGMVIRGEGRGRKLGYPTANLNPSNLTPQTSPLKHGIYAGIATIDGPRFEGQTFVTACFIGLAQVFDAKAITVEAHLLDFDADIYDATIHVTLQHFVRENMNFNSTEELIEQMQKDVEQTRSLIKNHAH